MLRLRDNMKGWMSGDPEHRLFKNEIRLCRSNSKGALLISAVGSSLRQHQREDTVMIRCLVMKGRDRMGCGER